VGGYLDEPGGLAQKGVLLRWTMETLALGPPAILPIFLSKLCARAAEAVCRASIWQCRQGRHLNFSPHAWLRQLRLRERFANAAAKGTDAAVVTSLLALGYRPRRLGLRRLAVSSGF